MTPNRALKVFSILFLLLALCAGRVQAGITVLFDPYVTYPAGASYAVGVGDFNHDGLNDVAVTNWAGELKIFLQNVAGSLNSAVTYTAGIRPDSLAVGDLNNDGWDDVVVTNFYSNTISLFLQQLDGTLAARTTYATGVGPGTVAVGDVNGDGLDDVAVANGNDIRISIFIQNNSGALNARVDYASPDAGFDDIAIGDVNGDGLNDVVKMNGQGLNPDLSVYTQTAGGVLSSAVSYSVAGSYSGGGIGIGDVTGDGKLDVVMSYGGNSPNAFIATFAQAGDGTLQPPVSYRSYDIPEALEVADVNEDGLADVVVAHGGWSAISVYLQQNNGTLSSYSLYPERYASHYESQGLAIGDINADTLPDLLVANSNYGLDVLYHAAPDTTSPVVTSIVRANVSPTNASSVNFFVTFSEPVSGVGIEDFTLNTTGVSDPLISSVTGSGTTYTVTVSTGTGDGTIRLDVPLTAAITDEAGNPLGSLPFISGESYTVDKTAPVVVSSLRMNPSPTMLASINFAVTFSEPVTGVGTSDFSLTNAGAGVSDATVSGISGIGSNYTVTVNTGTGNGTIRLNVVDNNSVLDTALNPLGGAVVEDGNFANGEIYTVIKSATFADTPLSHWANSYIERLYNAGVTGGCTTVPLNYCPANSITRAQMAIFLLRGIHGRSYFPPPETGTLFADVSLGSFGAAWIEQLAVEGITSGCGGGNFCPNAFVTRAQMAIFLVRAKHGVAFAPPTATGIFTDVPVDSFGADYIEQLVADSITSGCGAGIYCPAATVKRDSMAVFLVRAFNLP